jgi:hypothetical protein
MSPDQESQPDQSPQVATAQSAWGIHSALRPPPIEPHAVEPVTSELGKSAVISVTTTPGAPSIESGTRASANSNPQDRLALDPLIPERAFSKKP